MHAKYLLLAATAAVALWIGCSATDTSTLDPSSSSSGSTSSSGIGGIGFGGSGGIGFGGNIGQGGACSGQCSSDLHQVLDCNGLVVQECTGFEGCDMETLTCINACEAAKNNKQSVGCEYWATDMEAYQPTYCFAAFVANTWNTPAHLVVEHSGTQLPVESFTRIPVGQGPSLTYQPYDSNVGLPPGEVAIVFLSGNSGGAPNCPVTSAVPGAGMQGTGVSSSFRIESDVPVVAYQINPYGGGSVAVTGASLLLPTSAWDTNYIAVNAYQQDIAPPSLNIVATEDNTSVTMVPVAAVQGGGGIPSSAANTPFTFTINRGQNAQITQNAELTGSVIQSDKPIGFMAGQPCMRTPYGVAFCDHGEQMIPPVRALGSEYVGVMYRPRQGEPAIWRMVGAVDGTQLTWTPDVGGPATLEQGQVAEFTTGTPFVVTSQDSDHPYLLFTHMAGSQWNMLSDNSGYGDVDFVISVPPNQYMNAYVFFADPTYPETNLVVVRSRDKEGNFHDVDLDCAGLLTGWQAVGDYEWTRIDLITGDFQNVGNCSTGRHEIDSDGRFGLWVWGWGTPLTSSFTSNVSYGYPGGMNVQPINTVVIPPVPR
jgi:hypothetical protein